MIMELLGYEYKAIEEKGYTIYDEIGRMQNGDGTWSKVQKQEEGFVVTGTRYEEGSTEKKGYREVYSNIEDFKTGSVASKS